MKKILISIIIILILIFGICNVVIAANLNELKEERTKVQEEMNLLSVDLESLEVEVTENLEQLSKIDFSISQTEEKILELKKTLEEAEKEVQEIEYRLNHIEEIYNKQKKTLEKRLVALYEEGQTTYLDVLLNSSSIVDFISNYYLIGEIAEYDKDLLDNIEREKNQIEEIEQKLKNKKNQLQEAKVSQQKEQVTLENAFLVKNNMINNLTEEEKKIQEQLDLYSEQLHSIDNQILFIAMQNVDSDYVGGDFIWPLPGYTTITSPYGLRFHPILKVYSLHNGMDIGGPTGANVIAANKGIVVTAEYLTAYGNTIIIDHGGGVKTIYAHASELIARSRRCSRARRCNHESRFNSVGQQDHIYILE